MIGSKSPENHHQADALESANGTVEAMLNRYGFSKEEIEHLNSRIPRGQIERLVILDDVSGDLRDRVSAAISRAERLGVPIVFRYGDTIEAALPGDSGNLEKMIKEVGRRCASKEEARNMKKADAIASQSGYSLDDMIGLYDRLPESLKLRIAPYEGGLRLLKIQEAVNVVWLCETYSDRKALLALLKLSAERKKDIVESMPFKNVSLTEFDNTVFRATVYHDKKT